MNNRRIDDIFEVTLTLDDSGAYADGDLLAESQSIGDVLEDCTAPSVILQSLVLLDKSDQGEDLDILILSAEEDLGTENSAIAISDAEAGSILTLIPIVSSDYVGLVNSQIVVKNAQDEGMGVLCKPASGINLWIAAISRGTGSYATDGIEIKLGFLRG